MRDKLILIALLVANGVSAQAVQDFEESDIATIQAALLSTDGEGLGVFPADIQKKLAIIAERQRVWFLQSAQTLANLKLDGKVLEQLKTMPPGSFKTYILLTAGISGERADARHRFNHDLAFGGDCGHGSLETTDEASENASNDGFMPLARAQHLMLRAEPPTEAEVADLRA